MDESTKIVSKVSEWEKSDYSFFLSTELLVVTIFLLCFIFRHKSPLKMNNIDSRPSKYIMSKRNGYYIARNCDVR